MEVYSIEMLHYKSVFSDYQYTNRVQHALRGARRPTARICETEDMLIREFHMQRVCAEKIISRRASKQKYPSWHDRHPALCWR